MKTLPDCPSCSAADTLKAVSRDAQTDVTLAECSCCSKVCRVDARGRVLRYVERDVSGVVIDGP